MARGEAGDQARVHKALALARAEDNNVRLVQFDLLEVRRRERFKIGHIPWPRRSFWHYKQAEFEPLGIDFDPSVIVTRYGLVLFGSAGMKLHDKCA
jgi:hypothetical protein